MTALNALGSRLGLCPKTTSARVMAPRARWFPLLGRRLSIPRSAHTRAPLLVAATDRPHAGILPAAHRSGLAAPPPRPKQPRLQPLARLLRLAERHSQPLIRPQDPRQHPPVFLPPPGRLQMRQKRLDLVQALVDLLGLAHGGPPPSPTTQTTMGCRSAQWVSRRNAVRSTRPLTPRAPLGVGVTS